MSRARSAVGLFLIGAVYSASALVPVGASARPDVLLTIACGLALAVAIVVVAPRLQVPARTQFSVWFTLLFLNFAAVAIEGTLFAPAAAPPKSLAANLVRLAVVSALVAGIAGILFGGDPDSGHRTIPSRPWHAWPWRLAIVAAVYVLLYLALGGINYVLVTHPYYESHGSSLTVPAAKTVLFYEPIRGLMIALSVLPLALARPVPTRLVAIIAGTMLFLVGGVVPLLPQSSLPLYLRIASLWEIFGQNFVTGIACVYVYRYAATVRDGARRISTIGGRSSEL